MPRRASVGRQGWATYRPNFRRNGLGCHIFFCAAASVYGSSCAVSLFVNSSLRHFTVLCRCCVLLSRLAPRACPSSWLPTAIRLPICVYLQIECRWPGYPAVSHLEPEASYMSFLSPAAESTAIPDCLCDELRVLSPLIASRHATRRVL